MASAGTPPNPARPRAPRHPPSRQGDPTSERTPEPEAKAAPILAPRAPSPLNTQMSPRLSCCNFRQLLLPHRPESQHDTRREPHSKERVSVQARHLVPAKNTPDSLCPFQVRGPPATFFPGKGRDAAGKHRASFTDKHPLRVLQPCWLIQSRGPTSQAASRPALGLLLLSALGPLHKLCSVSSTLSHTPDAAPLLFILRSGQMSSPERDLSHLTQGPHVPPGVPDTSVAQDVPHVPTRTQRPARKAPGRAHLLTTQASACLTR